MKLHDTKHRWKLLARDLPLPERPTGVPIIVDLGSATYGLEKFILEDLSVC